MARTRITAAITASSTTRAAAAVTTAGALALTLALAGCSAEVVDTSDATQPSSAPGSADSSAVEPSSGGQQTDGGDGASTDPTDDATDDPTDASTGAGTSAVAPVTLPDGATWLYDVDHSLTTGGRLEAAYAGVALPHSTGLSVACDGSLTATDYDLAGAWDVLRGNLVLRDGAPTDLAVRVYLQLDGADLLSQLIYGVDAEAARTFGAVDPEATGEIQALVRGGDTLTVLTQLESGDCIVGQDPYVLIGDGYLTAAG